MLIRSYSYIGFFQVFKINLEGAKLWRIKFQACKELIWRSPEVHSSKKVYFSCLSTILGKWSAVLETRTPFRHPGGYVSPRARDFFKVSQARHNLCCMRQIVCLRGLSHVCRRFAGSLMLRQKPLRRALYYV
jgi:hypothetical protein